MTLFRLDASFRVDGSASREIADLVETEWLAGHPGERVERRHLGTDPLPGNAWAEAVTGGFVPAELRTAEQEAALKLSATLTDEILEADALLLAIPLYNYGLSQYAKVWIDLIIADPRAKSGQAKLLAGKKVVLVTTRGGSYAPGSPREGWDHATGYLTRILADVWGADLTVIERELTLVGVNPALDAFTDAAAELHTKAKDAARIAGQVLAA